MSDPLHAENWVELELDAHGLGRASDDLDGDATPWS